MSLLRLQSRITFIPKSPNSNLYPTSWNQDPNRNILEFYDLVQEVSTRSSFKNLSDSAKIVIPRKLISQMQGGTILSEPLISGLNAIIQRGDKVVIELGYFTSGFNGLRTIFEGYVEKIIPNVPLVVECRDTMFAVQDILFTFPPNDKLTKITQSKKGKPLKNPYLTAAPYGLNILLSNLLDVYEFPWINLIGDVPMGNVIWTKYNGARVLDELRSGLKVGYSIYSYFVSADIANYILENIVPNNPSMNIGCALVGQKATGPTMLIGYQDNAFAGNLNTTGSPETFVFEYNIINNNLYYMSEKDINLTIEAYSYQTKNHNQKISYTYPENSDGTHQDLGLPNNLTQDQVKEQAIKKYNNFAYTGFRGSFITFGEPYVTIGDKVTLTSSVYPEKYGTYQVVAVNRTFGTNGYRQEIELGTQTNFNKFDGTVLPKQTPPNPPI